nr:hypothetical protein [Variovorax boronicumulans]
MTIKTLFSADAACMPDIAETFFFHYAPGAYLEQIVESGELRASNAGGNPDEPPAVWFSARQTFEPTALKPLLRPDGTVQTLSFQQLAKDYGAMRFGLPASDSRLLNWKDACAAIGIQRDERRAMERKGQKQGGDPAHWFAILGPVALDELTLEIWMDGEWVAVVDDEEVASAA